jgi:hypothetical protein
MCVGLCGAINMPTAGNVWSWFCVWSGRLWGCVPMCDSDDCGVMWGLGGCDYVTVWGQEKCVW